MPVLVSQAVAVSVPTAVHVLAWATIALPQAGSRQPQWLIEAADERRPDRNPPHNRPLPNGLYRRGPGVAKVSVQAPSGHLSFVA